MHIVIALITAIAGLIWAFNALQRSGFDLNAFNPFTWHRRRKWHKKHNANPLYHLSSSLETAAILVIGQLKHLCLSAEHTQQKASEIFHKEFSLEPSKAQELAVSCQYLLKDLDDINYSLNPILKNTKAQFSQAQYQSLLQMLTSASDTQSSHYYKQQKMLSLVEAEFSSLFEGSDW